MQNRKQGITVPKILAILFSAGSLLTMFVGLFYQEGHAGFGLVLLMTSLICNVGIHLGVSDNPRVSKL